MGRAGGHRARVQPADQQPALRDPAAARIGRGGVVERQQIARPGVADDRWVRGARRRDEPAAGRAGVEGRGRLVAFGLGQHLEYDRQTCPFCQPLDIFPQARRGGS